MMSMILQKNKTQNGIAFHKTGKGDPIILIHGLGLRAESWIKQINDLKKHFTVYAIDLPGHGKSNLLKFKTITLKSYCEAIVDFIKTKKIYRPIIIGHSLGALITIEIAGTHTRLLKSGVAVTAIFNRSKEASQKVRLRAKEINENPNDNIVIHEPIQRWFGQSKSQNILKYSKTIQGLLRLNKKIFNLKGYASAYSVFANIKGNSKQVIKNIKIPMLYITGEKDFNSTPEMSKKLAKINKNKYIVIKNARHILPLTHSKQFNFHLNQFIKGLDSN